VERDIREVEGVTRREDRDKEEMEELREGV